MITFGFDENAVGWSKNHENNLVYLIHQKHYFEDLFKCRGYMYLNNIYESLGIKWDPTRENVLWIYGQDAFSIRFYRFGDSNKWIVAINQ